MNDLVWYGLHLFLLTFSFLSYHHLLIASTYRFSTPPLAYLSPQQDYVKSSSNIALSPILDTFNVREVLHIVHKCIVNQKCGRIVNMHPIGDICPFLITDKHYLMENLLCLMSNGE